MKKLNKEQKELISSVHGLSKLLKDKDVDKTLRFLSYQNELRDLQVELVKLQRDVKEKGRRVMIIVEGRDCAGKGGTIFRFTKYLPPRDIRIVALSKPSSQEQGQWYFQRYIKELPNEGEIVFFDRSWYNRAVVEPVNGFCTEEEYEQFNNQVVEFESMLKADGIELIKLWFSIDKKTQRERLDARKTDPLKQWKISPVDEKAQILWDDYTSYIDAMLENTHDKRSPWYIVDGNSKKKARISTIRHVLNLLDYPDKNLKLLKKKNEIVKKYKKDQ